MTALPDERLPEPWGQFIDRSQSRSFCFDGKTYQGYAGDTVTSALAANGVYLLSRSFKYHRPRASYTMAGFDANAYLRIDDTPNVNADLALLQDGMVATAQNVLGSLQRDFGTVTGWLGRFMPVGFYYRAFYRPNGIWKYWERLIRRTTGLGRIDTNRGRVGYWDKQYLFADVAVIGAGPAGLAAAIAAAERGASVLLVEESPQIGGSLNYARFGLKPDDVDEQRRQYVTAASENPNIRILRSATCSGWFEDNWLSIAGERRLYKLRASQVILCTGSVEQPAVFRNNDLPGVFPGSAVQRLLRLYGIQPGNRAVVLTSNPDGDDVARDLIDAGVEVAALVDINGTKDGAPDWLTIQGGEFLSDYEPVEARPGPGRKTITACVVAPKGDPNSHRAIACDLIVTSVGYAPLGQLACHSGGRLEYDDAVHAFRIAECPQRGQISGSVNHVYALDIVLADGRNAGVAAASAAMTGNNSPRDMVSDPGAGSINHPYPIYPHAKGKEFVDFDEDQTISDLVNAVADGFSHPELAKRYSTTGMGPSQGRLSATNAHRIVTRANGDQSARRAVTTQRPPFRPITFGVLAGRMFEPERLTPMHDWHVANNAELMPAGLWQRPARYCRHNDRSDDIASEVAAVRQNVGLIDVSTLGGIEIRGSDAAEFLNRIYTFAYLKQPINRTRYVLMTDESGSIVDDGVACRMAEDHFYVTTTTTGSDNVFRQMLRLRAEWRLNVSIVNVTSTYAAMNIAGPAARTVIQLLDSDIDFEQENFPYLAARRGYIGEIPTLAMRIGFVGELGYELHVPSSRALALWELLMSAGSRYDIRAVGVEAQRILRLEKGHIIVGQDTDGLTHPAEATLGWAVSKNKTRFVGKVAIDHLSSRELTRTLVGFRLNKDTTAMPEECNLIIDNGAVTGRVTSVAHSESVGSTIGLAYVAPAQSEIGTDIQIKLSNGRFVKAQVVELPFFDPDNTRQDV